jgi:hypothetical protein
MSPGGGVRVQLTQASAPIISVANCALNIAFPQPSCSRRALPATPDRRADDLASGNASGALT